MPYVIYRPLAAILFMAFLVACSTATPVPKATMDFDPSFDFSSVRKIAIQPLDRTVVSTVTVSDMQINRINEALTTELTNRGYQVVSDNAAADMLLNWHLVTQERTDVRTYNTSSRYNCWNCGSNIRVSQFTQGTFIVDMVDPLRLQSVWRSVIESKLRSQPDPERAEQNRRAAANAVFAEFPPK